MKTPLFNEHVEAGARIVDFNGWEMPLFYSGIIDEHKAVRQKSGVFDLCHMARFRVDKIGGFQKLAGNTTNDVQDMPLGRAMYSLVTDAGGGIIDDVIVYRLSDYFLVVANAGNRKAVSSVLEGEGFSDLTEETAMIAVQGPGASRIVEDMFGNGAAGLKNYGFAGFEFDGEEVIIARTGYTGEDGFELFFKSGLASRLWQGTILAGRSSGLKPAGLGARDILRLEAGMPLYGHELSMSVNPFEAGLGRFVSFKKSFKGKESLERYKTEEPKRLLKGIETSEKAVPRQGYPVYRGELQVGEVTSGTYSPALDKAIGMVYIKREFSEAGTKLEVGIRNKRIGFKVVNLPFYKRSKK
jgi:aminomethyltransferase